MELNYLWDTNTVIYYMQKQFPKSAEEFMDSVLTQYRPSLSTITEMELLCWKTATDRDIEIIKSFIQDSFIFELEQEVKDKTVEIRKQYNLKLPDAIIAATTIINNLHLITRNTKDFEKISNIQLINPFEI